jgi:uroporphyrin-III C-methyltransferase
VWIVTGTKKDGSLSADLRLAMHSNATVVVYMGMKQLPLIVDTYLQENMGDMPAAIIQHASLPQQKSVRGMIKDMPALVAQHQLTYPSIIIIGKVTDINLSLL